MSWVNRVRQQNQNKKQELTWVMKVRNSRKKDRNKQNYSSIDNEFDTDMITAGDVYKKYPSHFPQQGQSNFLSYIRSYLRRAAGPFDIGCTPDRKMYAHQKVVRYAVTPDGPVRKLLVFHRAGAGKTRSIVSLCNNFYFDPRPIIIILPTAQTKRNFLKTLATTPGLWSDFIRLTSKSTEDLQEVVEFTNKLSELRTINEERGFRVKNTHEFDTIRNILHNNDDDMDKERVIDSVPDIDNNIGYRLVFREKKEESIQYPASPIRIFTFNMAARKSFIRDNKASIIRWGKRDGWDPINGNPLDDSIILMDEFHNLYAPDRDSVNNPATLANLGHLRSRMSLCKGSVIVGFTASPIKTPYGFWGETQSGANALKKAWLQQFNDCMRIVRAGDSIEEGSDVTNNVLSNSGYISYFYYGDGRIFPRTRGKTRWTLEGERNPDNHNTSLFAVLPVQVKMVTLVGTNLVKYLSKVKDHISKLNDLKKPDYLERVILPYCNQGYGKNRDQSSDPTLDNIMENISLHSKLDAIARSIRENAVKTLVLVHKHAGFRHVLRVIREQLSHDNHRVEGINERGDKSKEMLAHFNDLELNDVGQNILCMVAEITEFGEGTDFFTVRRVIIVNPPDGLGKLHQLIGRVTRSCAFTSTFTAEDGVVQVDMYAAQLPTRLLEHYIVARLNLTKNIKRLFYESLRGKSYRDPHSNSAGDLSDEAAINALRKMNMDEGLLQEITSEGGFLKDDDKNIKRIRASFTKLVTAWVKWRDVIARREGGNNNSQNQINRGATSVLQNNNNTNINVSRNSTIVEGLMTVDVMRATRLVREQWAYTDFIKKYIIEDAIDGHLYDNIDEHV